jgi:PAS domain S-box-containing protein
MSTDAANGDDWHLTDDLHAEHGKGDPFAAAMRATRMSMIITDPRQPDNPIVFCNRAFMKLTGYGRDEIIGRNCRFLQGPETDPVAVSAIRHAIEERTDVNIDILNYRKDGSTFWNALYISPVINEAGELLFYFASQLDVTHRKDSEHRVQADKERFERAVKDRTRELENALAMQTALVHEVDHRVKNNLQMISSLIVMQTRTIPDPDVRESLRSMLTRVEALSTVHRRLYQSADVTRFDVADFVRDLVTDLVEASGRDIGVRFDVSRTDIPADQAAALALMTNESVTNALKHAFPGEAEGMIDIAVAREGDALSLSVSDNGVGMTSTEPNGTFGMNLVRSLAKQLKAQVDWAQIDNGTRVRIRMPITPVGGSHRKAN